MSDIDDLTAALIKGDPGETVPIGIVTAMAEAVLAEGWVKPIDAKPCQHDDIIIETNRFGINKWCQQCGAKLVTTGDTEAWMKPEDDDA